MIANAQESVLSSRSISFCLKKQQEMSNEYKTFFDIKIRPT
jgi:hypothetical protein